MSYEGVMFEESVRKGRAYEALLKRAPAQDTPEFIQFLRDNNVVVLENKNWLVIENFKYHSASHPWHTAFHKQGRTDFRPLFRRYWEWEWLYSP
jgi:hypothetical protein